MIAILSTPSSCDFTQIRIYQNRKSPSTPIGFQPVTWFHRYTCLGETELLGSVKKNIFGRLDFYFKDSNFFKDVVFSPKKKKHRLTKKTTFAAGYSIPFSMSPLGEKITSKKKRKRERNIRDHMGLMQIWGFSTPPKQIRRGVIGWVVFVQCLGGSM